MLDLELLLLAAIMTAALASIGHFNMLSRTKNNISVV